MWGVLITFWVSVVLHTSLSHISQHLHTHTHTHTHTHSILLYMSPSTHLGFILHSPTVACSGFLLFFVSHSFCYFPLLSFLLIHLLCLSQGPPMPCLLLGVTHHLLHIHGVSSCLHAHQILLMLSSPYPVLFT